MIISLYSCAIGHDGDMKEEFPLSTLLLTIISKSELYDTEGLHGQQTWFGLYSLQGARPEDAETTLEFKTPVKGSRQDARHCTNSLPGESWAEDCCWH